MTSTARRDPSATAPAGGGGLGLPRRPGAVRRYWSRHSRLADSLLALVVLAVASLGAMHAEQAEGPGRPGMTIFVVALILVSVSGFYVRRTRPILTVVLAAAAVVASMWAPGDIVLVPVLVAVYSMPIRRSLKASWVAAGIVEVAAILAAAVAHLATNRAGLDPFNPAAHAAVSPWLSLLGFAIQFGVAVALALAMGINNGNRRRYVAALIDRANQLAVERDQQALLATAAERARIARDMHDIVSHSLTMMTTLAEGAAVSATTAAPQAAEAMRAVAATGRTAMVDMRRMLGVLGSDAQAQGEELTRAPQPGFAELAALAEKFRHLGLPVTLRRFGPTPRSRAIQLTVYRLVQEALTNTLRYGRDANIVTVDISVHDPLVTASVTDNGHGNHPSTGSVGTGRGLLGMRERVSALGGTLDAGPRETGQGWIVRARLPLADTEPDHTPRNGPGQ